MSTLKPESKCKVHFKLQKGALDEQTPWPPCEEESLWGELTGQKSARLLNVPFYAKGVSYLDEVRLEKPTLPDGMSPDEIGPNVFDFGSVTRRSGHATVRAILISEEHRGAAEEAISKIEQLGCSWESAGRGLLAIDIPPEADQRSVMAALEASASAGEIYVDIGVLRDEDN